MARNLQNDQAQTILTLNGEQPKREIKAITKMIDDLNEKRKKLNDAGDTAGFNKATAEIKKLRNEQKGLEKSSFDLKKVLDNLSGATMRDLVKAQKELNAQMNNGSIARNTKEWDEHQKKLKAVKSEIKSVNAESMEGQSGFMKFANFTNQTWQLFAAAGLVITGVVTVMKKYMDMLNELEDTTANLKALTGLEDKDINKLTSWAKQMAANPLEGSGIRIRSSVNEIMEAYKLVGSAKPELLADAAALNEVTKQSMILSAASGMDLKDAVQGTTIALNQYGAGAEKASRFVNALGAGAKFGAVEVPYIAEALTKFGALAKQANVPLEQSIAAIEVLGAKGFQAEITGTGLKMMFVKMMTGARDTNPAIVGMGNALDNLNKKFSGPGGFNKMVDMFGEREVVIVRSLIAEREAFKNLAKQVTGTNTAVEQAQIASDTTNAKIAQATNQLNVLAMQLMSGVSPAFLKLANMTNVFLRVLVQLPQWLKENAGLLLTLSGVMITYTLIIQKNRIESTLLLSIEKLKLYWSKLNTAAIYAEAAARALLTGNINRSTTALKLMLREMGLNPYLAAGIAIAALTVLFYKMATRISESAKAYRDFKIESQVQTTQADQLFDALKNATIGTKERKELIDQINTTYGQYLTNQLSEASNLNAINKAQILVNQALTRNVALKMRQEAKDKVSKSFVEEAQGARENLFESITNSNGQSVSDIVKANINRIFTQNADVDKAYQLAAESMRSTLGKNVTRQAESLLKDLKSVYKKQAKEIAEIDKTFAPDITEANTTLSSSNDYTTNVVAQEKAYKEEKAKHEQRFKEGKETQIQYNTAMARIEKDNTTMLKLLKNNELDRLSTEAKKELELVNSLIAENKNVSELRESFIKNGDKNGIEKTNRSVIDLNNRTKMARENFEKLKQQFNDLKNQKEEVWVRPDTSQYADENDKKNKPEKAKKVDPHKAELDAIDLIFAEKQKKLKDNRLKGFIDEEEFARKMLKLTLDTLKLKQDLYFGGNQKEMQEVDKWEANEIKTLKTKKLEKTAYFEALNTIEKAAFEKRKKLNEKVDKEYWDYGNQIADIKLKSAEDADKAMLNALKDGHSARALQETQYGNLMRATYNDYLEEHPEAQNEYNNKMLALDLSLAESRVLNAQQFVDDFKKIKFNSDADRLQAEIEVNNEIEAADKDLANAQKAIDKKTVSDRKAIRKEIEEIEKNLGISDRQTKRKEYKDGLALLKTKYAEELEAHKDNEKKKAEITAKYNKSKARIEAKQAETTAENINAIANQSGELSAKLQEAETLRIENKYAKQLKAAKGNAEKTAQIEVQMEEEKKNVKKKYADIDFAITSAKIISSTALAIMKALETDGIAGPILATIVGATGLAELAVAAEQRNEVANLWTGGYTAPGDKYKPAGIVHAGEFVANQDSVRNAPMRKVFNLVDYAQRNNRVANITNDDIIRSLGVRQGFANGGFVGGSSTVTNNNGISTNQLIAAIQTATAQSTAVNAALLAQIQAGIKANVSIAGDNGIAKQTDNYNKLLNNAKR